MTSGYDFFATAPAGPAPVTPAAPATPSFAPAGFAPAGFAPPAFAPPVAAPPPGWYADPHAPHQLRWFDGAAWTPYVAPVPTMQRNRWMELLLPVNRSGLSIAAGYVGLFSILLIFAPVALLLGVLALRDLATKPTVGGRGRAWFAVVAGGLGTLALLALILR